jgi:hypothetical protein
MSLFRSIAKAVYREYDRRIKRASLITEYGASHHAHAHATHEEAAHADHEDAADEAEIVNVPRGTPVVEPQSVQKS